MSISCLSFIDDMYESVERILVPYYDTLVLSLRKESTLNQAYILGLSVHYNGIVFEDSFVFSTLEYCYHGNSDFIQTKITDMSVSLREKIKRYCNETTS